MKVKTEIELKDLIQIILIIIGGILTYCFVNAITVKNDTVRTKQLLLEEIPALYPSLQLNYTNQFNESKDTLYIKVYMKNYGKFPVFVPSPNMYLLSQKDTLWGYKTPNLFSTYGSLAPGQERKIEYIVYQYPEIPDSIRMRYPVNLDEEITKIYSEVLSESLKSMSHENIDWITNKKYDYYEETYQHGDNTIWNDFFDNPR
ncbi:hypothetical protein [Dokdonia sp.]|uniref:hypothetical protein n=1 Tax=Dokdonia sp. TaxID=2024995 RepID=UPI0032665903